MQTGYVWGMCLRASPVLRVSCSVADHRTTGERRSINPVMMTLGADDAQTCSSPGIAASLWYDLGDAVVLIPKNNAVPTPFTEGRSVTEILVGLTIDWHRRRDGPIRK